MSNPLRHRAAEVAATLDRTAADTAEAARRGDIANARMGAAAGSLNSGSARIADALAEIAESAAVLRAAEARLSFESARLKRSAKAMRENLGRLDEAGELLRRRAQAARAVAETADRTATLIGAIEAAAARGESFEHLLVQGHDAANPPKAHGRVT